MPYATVDSRGRIMIHTAEREAKKIEPGDIVEYTVTKITSKPKGGI